MLFCLPQVIEMLKLNLWSNGKRGRMEDIWTDVQVLSVINPLLGKLIVSYSYTAGCG